MQVNYYNGSSLKTFIAETAMTNPCSISSTNGVDMNIIKTWYRSSEFCRSILEIVILVYHKF